MVVMCNKCNAALVGLLLQQSSEIHFDALVSKKIAYNCNSRYMDTSDGHAHCTVCRLGDEWSRPIGRRTGIIVKMVRDGRSRILTFISKKIICFEFLIKLICKGITLELIIRSSVPLPRASIFLTLCIQISQIMYPNDMKNNRGFNKISINIILK